MGFFPSVTVTRNEKASDGTAIGGEIQVVLAWLGVPKVPGCAGAVWVQEMVSGSPSGSVAVTERVTTSPATGAEGDTVMEDTFGGRFTTKCFTVSWKLCEVDAPWPSLAVAWKVKTVSAVKAGEVQVGFRTVRELKVPTGDDGAVWVQA